MEECFGDDLLNLLVGYGGLSFESVDGSALLKDLEELGGTGRHFGRRGGEESLLGRGYLEVVV